jgi:hypothetical protein
VLRAKVFSDTARAATMPYTGPIRVGGGSLEQGAPRCRAPADHVQIHTPDIGRRRGSDQSSEIALPIANPRDLGRCRRPEKRLRAGGRSFPGTCELPADVGEIQSWSHTY